MYSSRPDGLGPHTHTRLCNGMSQVISQSLLMLNRMWAQLKDSGSSVQGHTHTQTHTPCTCSDCICSEPGQARKNTVIFLSNSPNNFWRRAKMGHKTFDTQQKMWKLNVHFNKNIHLSQPLTIIYLSTVSLDPCVYTPMTVTCFRVDTLVKRRHDWSAKCCH